MPSIAPETLKTLASRYIWWQPPEIAVRTPQRVVAQVMDSGDCADVEALAMQVGDDGLRQVLARAQPDQFRARSWAYWHYRLGLCDVAHVPPLPSRPRLTGAA